MTNFVFTCTTERVFGPICDAAIWFPRQAEYVSGRPQDCVAKYLPWTPDGITYYHLWIQRTICLHHVTGTCVKKDTCKWLHPNYLDILEALNRLIRSAPVAEPESAGKEWWPNGYAGRGEWQCRATLEQERGPASKDSCSMFSGLFADSFISVALFYLFSFPYYWGWWSYWLSSSFGTSSKLKDTSISNDSEPEELSRPASRYRWRITLWAQEKVGDLAFLRRADVFVPIALKSQLSAHSYILTVFKSLSGYYIEDFVWFCFLNSLCWNRFEEWNDRAFDVSCDAEVSGRNPQSKERPEVIVEFVFFTYVTYVQKPVLHFLSKFAQTIEELEMEEVRLQRLRYFTMFCDDIGPGLDYESSTKVLKRWRAVTETVVAVVTGWGFWKHFCTGDSCHFFSCVLLFHTRDSRCYQVNNDWNL